MGGVSELEEEWERGDVVDFVGGSVISISLPRVSTLHHWPADQPFMRHLT